jgi:hypothetical protein
MPAKILLVTVGLRENEQITGNRSIVSDNVRWSAYFVQIFEDDWGPRDLFRKLFLLAIECRDDVTMPMRQVVVCLKRAPYETHAEVLAFRKELEERTDVEVIQYGGCDELKARLTEVFNGWAREMIDSSRAAETHSAPAAEA